MPRTFGLIDGNSFYCSCERAFQPRLQRLLVVVLSNNDGCAISRTAEAKPLGVKMGDPWHLVRSKRELTGVEWLSSNYALYGDMSRCIFHVLAERVPRAEPYSIDEMFLDLDAMGDLTALCRSLRADVLRITKIPTCTGWGPSKTIAELANGLAKNNPSMNGVCDLASAETRAAHYAALPPGEVWGISWPLAVRHQSPTLPQAEATSFQLRHSRRRGIKRQPCFCRLDMRFRVHGQGNLQRLQE